MTTLLPPLLIVFTLVLAVLLVVNALRGQRRGLGWATVAALLALGLAALIADNAERGLWDRSEWALFAVALLLVAAGIVVALRGRRAAAPTRVNRRSGWAVAGAGGVLLAMVALVPVVAAALDLQDSGAETGETAEVSTYDRALDVFDQVTRLIGEEAGLDSEEVALQLDAGSTVTQLVRANDGDLERVVQGISAILTQQVEALAANGDLDPTAAAIALAQMENAVRIGVVTQLTGLLQRFDAEDRPGA